MAGRCTVGPGEVLGPSRTDESLNKSLGKLKSEVLEVPLLLPAGVHGTHSIPAASLLSSTDAHAHARVCAAHLLERSEKKKTLNNGWV